MKSSPLLQYVFIEDLTKQEPEVVFCQPSQRFHVPSNSAFKYKLFLFLEYGTSKMADRPHFRNTAMVEEANVVEVFAAKMKQL